MIGSLTPGAARGDVAELGSAYMTLADMKQTAMASLVALHAADPGADIGRLECELDTLDEALDACEFAIASTPADSLAGVGVRLIVAAVWTAEGLPGAGALVGFVLNDVRALQAGGAS